MKKIFFIVCLFYSNTTLFSQNSKVIDLQHVVDTFIANHQIPAAAISIVQLDTIMFAVGGVNKNKAGKPIAINAKFHIGSNTKAITSFIAAKLVEEGKIGWASKLIDIVPALKDSAHRKFENITLEQLLSHTAGIRAYNKLQIDFAQVPEFEGNSTAQRLAFAHYTLQRDTLLSVGNYLYSNAGYTLAALMLEKTAQMSWEELVINTFKTLSINDFCFDFPNRDNIDNPWGHWIDKTQTLQPIAPDFDYHLGPILAPAGDVSMSIESYAKFIQLHVKGLNGDNNYLQSETYEKMHFGIENYALGWGNGKNVAGLVSTHSGSAGNFYCVTMIFKEKKMAVVIMINAGNPTIEAAVIGLRRGLYYNWSNAQAK